MDATIDIDVLPISRHRGYDQSEIPGLHVAVPPRRPARGRQGDMAVLYLTLKGNAPITSKEQSQLLTEAAHIYYHSTGSVTAAMRSTIESLNQVIQDRNLRSSVTGLQTLGLFTMVVAHGERLYLAQSGPIHTFIISPTESQHLYDSQIAGRGLGQSRTPPIRFSQARMAEGGLLILSPAPPPTWSTATLRDAHQLKLESLYRQLLDQSGPDLTAVVLIIQPGTGELHLLQRTQPGQTAAPAAAGEIIEPPPVQHPDIHVAGQEAQTQPETFQESIRPAPQESPTQQSTVTPAQSPPASARRPQGTPPAPPGLTPIPGDAPMVATSPLKPLPESSQHSELAPESAARRVSLPAIGPVLLAAADALGGAWGEVKSQLRTLLGRMLPGEGIFTIPSSVMALIAISVPLILVTVASVVYFQRGRAVQYQQYFDQAKQSAQQAVGKTDPLDRRGDWEATLFYLDRAEEYQITPESRALRNLAQDELDQMNAVTRLDFQPAIIGGLSEAIHVKRMIATTDDLYMLNSNEGNVLRAWLTGRGYEMDPTFRCGPGAYGGYIVGPLVDITALPRGNELNATVLAIDANGNLLYCIPGEAPLSNPLVPPDSNWGAPIALTLDTGNLYVLDPQTNAVWIYRGSNGSFRDRPRLYFSADVPPMKDVTGLANNRQDLYLLHGDGHVTTCTFSTVETAPTRCTDPALFSDPRPGRQEGPVIPDALFTQIQFSPPPDPSIYLMDPNTQSIYHFSLRLTLQRLYRSASRLPDDPATAFAISPNRTVFLAFGRQVYYANFP